eukprot:2784099-Ditylum_brightwellii.AAC.1
MVLLEILGMWVQRQVEVCWVAGGMDGCCGVGLLDLGLYEWVGLGVKGSNVKQWRKARVG